MQGPSLSNWEGDLRRPCCDCRQGQLLTVGELPRAGLGPPAPDNRCLIKIWQLLSKLEYDRIAKFQCPGVSSQAGSRSGSTSSLLCGFDQIDFPISVFTFINGEY